MPEQKEGWAANDENEAYRVAEIISTGMCAPGTIAQILWPGIDKGKGFHRVYGLLESAFEKGYLKLESRGDDELRKRLEAEFKGITFHVVNESIERESQLKLRAVHMKTAEVIAARIEYLLGQRKLERRIVVANAGGPNLSQCVRYLKWHATTANPEQLLFISLNAAAVPTTYGSSANVVAVRMAEIYQGSHIALTSSMSKEIEDDYAWALKHIDLLICGAGSWNGLLFRYYSELNRFKLPGNAVGDICLIPLTSTGVPITLSGDGRKYVTEHLRPSPNPIDLGRLAFEGKVIVVFGESPLSPLHQRIESQGAAGSLSGETVEPLVAGALGGPSSKVPLSKTPIATAALRGKLVHTCILGSAMAKEILEYVAKGSA